MMKILLTISYLGGAYHGWQVQSGCTTVQQTLQTACERLFGCSVKLTGCSRTDAGVHANRFCCTVSPADGGAFRNRVPVGSVVSALNCLLPRDIAVNGAAEVADSFHPRYDAVGKEYEYLIRDGLPRSPFWEGRAWQYAWRLDTDLMNSACAPFMGTHDFAGFMSSGSDVADTVRTISSFETVREGELIRIRISADGFLYNMVRILAGTLVAVSEGKLKTSALPELIVSRDRSRAGITAPACGLYLNRVFYE